MESNDARQDGTQYVFQIPEKLNSFLDGEEFNALMQSYRHAPVTCQGEVIDAFEAVKEAIRRTSVILLTHEDAI